MGPEGSLIPFNHRASSSQKGCSSRNGGGESGGLPSVECIDGTTSLFLSDRESASPQLRDKAFHPGEALRGTTPQVRRECTGVATNPMGNRFAFCRRRNPN